MLPYPKLRFKFQEPSAAERFENGGVFSIGHAPHVPHETSPRTVMLREPVALSEPHGSVWCAHNTGAVHETCVWSMSEQRGRRHPYRQRSDAPRGTPKPPRRARRGQRRTRRRQTRARTLGNQPTDVLSGHTAPPFS